VLIWLAAISQIMGNLNNWVCYIAWAGGYATGSYIGLYIEERIALGIQVIRIITNQDSSMLTEALSNNKYGVTIVDAKGTRGPVKLIFTVVPRKKVNNVITLINAYVPNSFYSVEDVRNASQTNYSPISSGMFSNVFGSRKAK
jgi:uncharacterized protein YebE (UPF0316 family)